MFVSDPCTRTLIIIKGTAHAEPAPQGNKQVVFKVHGIEEKVEMNCPKDYSKYFTSDMAEIDLATFTLIVTMSSGFGYAIGEIPAGVHLNHPYRVGMEPALAQYMHGVRLCNDPTCTIVSDRKKSGTKPPAIQNTLRDSGIFSTSVPVFSDDEISKFVAVCDAVARVKDKSVSVSRQLPSGLGHAREVNVQNSQSARKEGPG